MAERFLYEVHPVRPFLSPDGKEIKKACSVQLTKDEVKEYMKKCTIYRKFSGSNNKMERVTLSNLDELHVKVKGEEVAETPAVVPEAPVVEDSKAEEVVEEAPAEEAPIIEEKIPVVEEAIPQEVVEEVTTEEPEAIAEDEEVVEESVDPEEDPEETITVDDILKEGTVQNSNNQYHGKNKKKHH